MMRADELAASGAIGCLGLPVLSEREALAGPSAYALPGRSQERAGGRR
jgi:hypothetical protein